MPDPAIETPILETPTLDAPADKGPLFNPAIEEHFAMYDKKPAEPAKPVAKAPEKPKEPAKPAEKPKVEAKVDNKPKTEAPKPEAKPAEPAEKPVEEHKNIKALRTSHEAALKKNSEYEAKIKEYEAKLAESSKVQPVADEKAWQERLTAKEKELTEFRNKLAEHDFTQSADYQDRYYKPYVNDWKRGMQSIMAMQVQNPDGTTRQATQQDAELLLSLPDNKAAEVARQMFGDDVAALVMVSTHRSRISEKMEMLNAARADYARQSEEKRNKDFIERQGLEEARSKLWVKLNEEIGKSSPWYQTDESDPEGSELLTKGYSDIDRIFSAEFNQGKMEDVVKAHATLRHKAASWDRLNAAHEKLKAQLEAITKERDELLDSAPKPGEGARPPVVDESDKSPSEILANMKWGGR